MCQYSRGIRDVIGKLRGINLRSFDCVFVLVGGNDLYDKEGNFKRNLIGVIEGLEGLVGHIVANGPRAIINPLLLKVNPSVQNSKYVLTPKLVALFNKTAKYVNRRLLTVIDSAINTMVRPAASKFYMPDGVHLNQAGKLIMARGWLKYL